MRIDRRLLAGILACTPMAASPAGALDPTFGTAGKAAVPGYSLAIQTDGKIVALGAATVTSGGFGNLSGALGLARLTTAGAVDFSRADSIGSCGFCSGAVAVPGAVVLQSNGAIVTVASFESSSLNTGACKNVSFVSHRHIPTGGGVDTSYGSGGTAHFAGGVATGGAIQPDGMFVFVGSKKNYVCLGATQPDDHSVARLTTGGVLDVNFGSGGVVNSPIGAGADQANAVAVRADGKIAVAGHALNVGGHKDFAYSVYSAAGVLETSVLLDMSLGAEDVAFAMAVQPDGNVVLGGSASNNLALARVLPAGTYDPTFGSGGRFLLPGVAVRGLGLQPDGKIVAVATNGDVLRLTSAGALDTGFGNGGRIATGMTGVQALALQGDGKIVVGSDTQVARVDPLATPPLALNPTGIDFLGQSLHTTSPARPVTITNTTGSTLTVSSVTSTVGFAVTHDCTTLAPGATCTAQVTYTPLFEGPNAGDLIVTGSTSVAKLFLFGTAEKSLTTHYYRSILRRAPDAPGKAFWESEAARMTAIGANVNETWFAMASFFYFSAEYVAFNRTSAGFVTDLYTTFFNRAPDGPGLAYWVGQLDSGMPREVVLASFMFSPEFLAFSQGIFGNTATRAESDMVMDFYRGLLARLPDVGGFSIWRGQLQIAQCQGAVAVNAQVESISSQFANGAEYAARGRTHAQFVGDLYNAFLRRGGDLAGVQFWINQLSGSTLTRDQVRQAFVASTEFQGRVTSVVNQGCLP